MKIWRVHIACWIPKATNKHLGHIILIDFPQRQLLHEGASMLRFFLRTSPVPFNLCSEQYALFHRPKLFQLLEICFTSFIT